jgi:hypothetical protein
MKNLKNMSLGLSIIIFLACGHQEGSNENTSSSGSDTLIVPPNELEESSRKAVGVGEGNQKDSLGFPSNQSNLNSDSIRPWKGGDSTKTKGKTNSHQ